MSRSEVEPSLASLPEDQQRRLAEIVEGYMVAREEGLAPDPAEYLARHPDLAEPLRGYLESVEFLHQAAMGVDGERPAPVEAVTSEKRLGDYQLMREIGRGGMGVVYEARQISLDRRVALKVLPFAAVLDRKQIARFRNEAQAAARLQHPHIVPVYAVGCERGVHYYAMQYIEGQSLDRAIRELSLSHPGDRRGPRSDDGVTSAAAAATTAPGRGRTTPGGLCSAHGTQPGAYFRMVAELGVQAADALEHAHECGIVHRDVKPSNLLLDTEGTLWVTDFGLARLPIDSALTGTGDVLGTLRYMSPEQGQGRAALVDRRTDVYSLGMTLYELLTLRAPFETSDRHELLRRIEHEEPSPPRRVCPAVPVDLETIVLKAIAKSPDQRYDTAADLGDDLRRFLGGQTVRARRPTLLDRAAKWTRRHQATVAAALGVLVLALAGLACGALLLAREHHRTKAALDQAEANYAQVREVVDRFVVHHAEQLADLPGTEPLRRDLLVETLRYYRGFIARAGDDPALKADLARTHFKVGTITEQIGDRAEAMAAYRRAQTIYAELLDSRPDEPDYAAGLALCRNNLGLLLARGGDADAAERAYRDALDVQERLAAQYPERPAFRKDLALTCNNLGLLLCDAGRASAAEAAYRRAIGALETLVERYPGRPDYARNLAAACGNLGFVESKEDPASAAALYHRAIEIQERLIEDCPNVLAYQSDVALTYGNLGAVENHAGRRDEALRSYRRAVALGERVCRLAPAMVRYRVDLAVSHNNLGRTLTEDGRLEDACESFEAARAILEDVVEDYPDVPGYRSSLGGVWNNRGIALERRGQLAAAAESFRQAIEHQEIAAASAPGVARFREFLEKHRANYRRVLRLLERPDEALAQRADAELP